MLLPSPRSAKTVKPLLYGQEASNKQATFIANWDYATRNNPVKGPCWPLYIYKTPNERSSSIISADSIPIDRSIMCSQGVTALMTPPHKHLMNRVKPTLAGSLIHERRSLCIQYSYGGKTHLRAPHNNAKPAERATSNGKTHVKTAECPGVSPGIPLLTDYATSSIITMMSADPTRSVGVRTTPIHSTLRMVAEMGSAVDSSAVLSEPISATPCI